MALDPRYILMQGLEQYLVDKDTGLPLANGEVWFFADNNRNSLKNVYELTGAPPNYNYAPLPNPIILSAVGTIQDANGDNVAIYYLPYSNVDPEQIELYYIAVFRQGEGPNGVPQFTREAWPNITASTNPVTNTSGTPTNQISNPQFVEVLFNPSNNLSISYGGIGTKSVEIAPNWTLNIQHTGNGTVTVARQLRTGSSLTPTNTPYVLQITGSTNIAELTLVQRLENNPAIFTPTSPNVGGYINAGILLGPNTPQTTITYAPSSGTDQLLLTASGAPGTYTYNSQTVQLNPSDNPNTPTTGYVDIVIGLSPLGTSLISSVQIIGEEANAILPYDEQPVNRQLDYLSHYYKPQLAYKPIPSYLIGWDFPVNPAQLGATQAATAIGANASKYVWDQAIIFQSADSGVGVTRGAVGQIVLTAAATTKMALIQYLDAAHIKNLLQGRMAVNIMGSTTVPGGATGVVQIYWTADANLPDIKTPNFDSIVATLAADGSVATLNGTWTGIERSNLGTAAITIPQTNANTFFEINLAGWEQTDKSAIDTATFGAIVVSFPEITMGQSISFQSISLCQGDIATVPAPLTNAQTLLQCQEFYYKTFNPLVTPAQNVGQQSGEFSYPATVAGAATNYCPSLFFPTTMRTIPTVTYFNPAAANANVRDESNNADCSNTTNWNLTRKELVFSVTGNGATQVGSLLAVHLTADARLGAVN